MNTRTLLAGTVAALGLTAGLLAPASAAPDTASGLTAAAVPSYKKYVAMGDSYTAGPLIPWNSTWCFRSNNNYPAWLATDLGLYYKSGAFNDVSCSSADTTNLTQSQPTPTADLHFTTQAPQLEALTLDTDLVTLGMGGNDYTVFGSVIGCGDYRDEDPTGSPCRDHYTINGIDTLSAALNNTGRNLERSVALIKERAPAAKVVLVGYPRILPPTGYCPDVVPFADGDYAWADYLNRKLNTVMRQAATRKGALYVDTYGPALGHDACAGDAAWVRGQSTDLFAGVSYHPNAAGMRAISKLVLKALGLSTSTNTSLRKAPAGADTSAELRKQRWARQHADELVPTD
ncbi:SGNH/GDSL hydrolase family protein [Nocardioides speluncae]|uniref:SGNH/GDSL hydrolase family protein n=1 Tax=Nocardioides speluncae TaxID=2670337 RepID=UPI000D69AB87|nr:SGNH/GDSL hydrolase family protein [Nocardioides speluncae]